MNRCPNLNQVPLTCKLKYNPDDPCCPLPDCPAIIPPTAGPGSTLAPTAHPPPMPGKVQTMSHKKNPGSVQTMMHKKIPA